MMTSAAARFSFDEKHRGSIEVGKLGDFVVLDDHFLTVPAERLRTMRADVTVVGGRIAFERERANGTERATKRERSGASLSEGPEGTAAERRPRAPKKEKTP
jgi:hypothetical protein